MYVHKSVIGIVVWSCHSYTYICSADPLVQVVNMCLTYIVVQIIPINELFCGGALNYDTTVSPPGGPVVAINDTIRNITNLISNTSYEITVDALIESSSVHQTKIDHSTLQPLGM